MSALKAAGKKAADAKLAHIHAQVRAGRYSANTSVKNMIRALEMHPHLNTLEDWERYFTAKHIVRLSSKRRRSNPTAVERAARYGVPGEEGIYDPGMEGEVTYGRAKRVSYRSKARNRRGTVTRKELDDMFGTERPVTRTRRARGETRAERRAANKAAFAARRAAARPAKRTTRSGYKDTRALRTTDAERRAMTMMENRISRGRQNPASGSLKNIPDYELVQQLRYYKARGNAEKVEAIHAEMGRRVAAKVRRPNPTKADQRKMDAMERRISTGRQNPGGKPVYWVLRIGRMKPPVVAKFDSHFKWNTSVMNHWASMGYTNAYGPFTSKKKAQERADGILAADMN